jgi:hypothetical protein
LVTGEGRCAFADDVSVLFETRAAAELGWQDGCWLHCLGRNNVKKNYLKVCAPLMIVV